MIEARRSGVRPQTDRHPGAERGLRRGSGGLPEGPGAGLWDKIPQTVVPRGTESCRELILCEVMTLLS